MKTTNIQLQVHIFSSRFIDSSLKMNYHFLVNSVAWAPHELGAILACASSDGKISIHEYKGKKKKKVRPFETIN